MKESLDIDNLYCRKCDDITDHVVMFMEKTNGNFDKMTVCNKCNLSTKKEVEED
jgi:ribosomal protein L44E